MFVRLSESTLHALQVIIHIMEERLKIRKLINEIYISNYYCFSRGDIRLEFSDGFVSGFFLLYIKGKYKGVEDVN